MQLFMTSMNALWIYDYVLTLGDEVRSRSHSLIMESGPDDDPDDLCLVKKEIQMYVPSNPPLLNFENLIESF